MNDPAPLSNRESRLGERGDDAARKAYIRVPFETSIGEIERVLGFQLLASYRQHVPIWYGQRPSTVIGAIADAGWRASRLTPARIRPGPRRT